MVNPSALASSIDGADRGADQRFRPEKTGGGHAGPSKLAAGANLDLSLRIRGLFWKSCPMFHRTMACGDSEMAVGSFFRLVDQ
jgi:hypothetical protein